MTEVTKARAKTDASELNSGSSSRVLIQSAHKAIGRAFSKISESFSR